jgi:hypothetical protein
MMKSPMVRLCRTICVLLIPAFLLSTLPPSTAHAEDDWLFAPYLRADLGSSITVDDRAEFDDPGERDSVRGSSSRTIYEPTSRYLMVIDCPQQMTIVTRMASRTNQTTS